MSEKKQNLFFLAILSVSIYIFGLNTGAYIDDAFIYLRVVKNIANGIGPVINQGDTHFAVTSPLWTFSLAYLYKVFNNFIDLITLTKIFYIVMLIFASFFTYQTLRIYVGGFSVFSPLIVFSNRLAQAFVGGETALVYFALAGVLWALMIKKNHILTGFFLAVAYLARGELIFLTPVILIFFIIESFWEKREFKKIIFDSLSILLPFITLSLLWHLYYFYLFGVFFPSTFEAKMIQGKSGWPLYSKNVMPHIYDAVCSKTYLLPLAFIGLYYLGIYSYIIFLFTLIHYIVYSILTIPDYGWYYYDFMFIIPIYTVFGVKGGFDFLKRLTIHYFSKMNNMTVASQKIINNVFLIFSFVTFSIVLLLVTDVYKKNISFNYSSIFKDNHNYFDNDERYRNYVKVAEWLNKHIDESDTILTPEVGIISYFLEKGSIRDINGLASPGITLETMSNYEFFISKYLPRYIISPWNKQPEYHFYFDRQKEIFYLYKKVHAVDESAKYYNTSVFELIPEKDRYKYIDEVSQKRKDRIKLPNESDDILYTFDWGLKNNIHSVIMNGWAYIKGNSSENSKIYLVFKSNEKTYIFDTNRHKRPDVTTYFKTLNFDDSGFDSTILKDSLEAGEYKIGIYIEKDNIKKLQFTDNLIKISNRDNIQLPQESNDIEFNFDAFKDDIHSVTMNGWAYIKGNSSENSKIYLVFKSNEKTYIFDTNRYKRPDVTAYFKTLNFDDSGFDRTVLTRNDLKSGTYRIGVLIEKDNIKKFKFTDKIIVVK